MGKDGIPMNMKEHILAALREKLDQWEDLLDGLNEAQINAPLLPSNWTIKHVVAHLWVWQQRSIAWVEAARLDREPVFPRWSGAPDPDTESGVEQTNAWVYETYKEFPWPQIHQSWQDGFQRFLELAGEISERDLLDSGRYAWLAGSSLANILLSSYDHHQEHLEKLQAWLAEHTRTDITR